jgi:DNA-binding CsgD family transcriptional regulator
MAIIAGRDLDLRRSRRHLMGRISMDVLTRLAAVRDVRPLAGSQPPSNRLGLTRRPLEIDHWLVAGKTDWEIGKILRISHKTVNDHVEKMKSRYGVHSRNQFVAAFVREGGLPSAAPHDEKTRQRQ